MYNDAVKMQKNTESALPRELSDLIADLTHATQDGFYRRLYRLASHAKNLDIQSILEWRKLPFLTKSDLIATSLRHRIYCDLSDVEECIDATSGTSGGEPLFVARSHMAGFEFRKNIHDFSRPVLCASQPTPQRVDYMVQAFNPGGASLVLDAQNISASVSLAKYAGTRSIIMPSHLAREVAENIRVQGFSDRITSVELNGGAISADMANMIFEILPQASITLTYSSTETEAPPVAVTRTTRDTNHIGEFYPQNGFFLELIDPDTLQTIEPAVGAEGELLLTRWMPRPFAFPLIRYRTGDMVKVAKCHINATGKYGSTEPISKAHTGYEPLTDTMFTHWSFSVLGRREMDFIKIPGGVLRSDEIERALRREFGNVVMVFEAECVENVDPASPQIGLVIRVDMASEIPLAGHTAMLAEHLRVSPSFTYGDGVRKGMYEPLVCKALNRSEGAGKLRRLRKIEKHT